jgi:diketogulonate reductase-like aldo/keto reductase
MQMPPMLYGTAWKKEQTTDLVVQAVKYGFRGIDTACQPKHYDEKRVGNALSLLYKEDIVTREELFLQTKFTPLPGQNPNRIPYDPNDSLEQQIATSFEVPHRNLQTNYIDSYILHSPISSYTNLIKVSAPATFGHRAGEHVDTLPE